LHHLAGNVITFSACSVHLNGTNSTNFNSGIRWTLAQLLMQKSEMGLDNPVDMVYHVQPWMILSLLPIAAFFEGEPTIKYLISKL